MRAAVAFVLGLLVAVAIGCGGRDGTIPRGSTGTIKDHLDSVRATLKKKNCDAIPAKITKVRSDITRLEARDVPAKLTRNLNDGLDQLSSAATQECADNAIDEVKTQTTDTQPVTTTEPEPTTTESTTTDETPTDTEPTLTDTGPSPTDTQPTGGFEPGTTGEGGVGG